MVKLDLHGVRHADVKPIVENFIFQNQGKFPLEIICGNSEKMILLVKEVTNCIGAEIHMYRYGVIVVRRWI